MMHVFVIRSDGDGPPRLEELVSSEPPCEIPDGRLYEVAAIGLPHGASLHTLLRRSRYGGRKARSANARLESYGLKIRLVRQYFERRVHDLATYAPPPVTKGEP
jgi:hypothetical protein